VKIPSGTKKTDRLKRLAFVQDVKERCLVSRIDRRQSYSSNRMYYLYGTDGSFENEDIDTGLGPPPGNKIYPHLGQLRSFLYAQETTRFSVEPGVDVPKEFLSQTPALGRYVNDEWHRGNGDITFGLALEWALVFNTTLVKPIWRKNGVYPHIVLPHNFGVLREDMPMLSRQEAFVEAYCITRGQLRNELEEVFPASKVKEIMDRVLASAEPAKESSPAFDRIMMGSMDPLNGGAGSGVIDWLTTVSTQYMPRVREEMVEMYEQYIYDDEIKDYRVFTIASPDIVIFDRPIERMFLKNTEPYIQICPNPSPDYFWGISEVERLAPLQRWRNQRMAQIAHLLDMQAHPPSTMSNFPGDIAELQYVLDSPNGLLNQPDSGGMAPKAERVKIELPENLFAEINMIDDLFDEMSGLPAVAQGRGEMGVRSQAHASQLIRAGTSRAKARALIVEDQLEGLATLYLKIMQRYDESKLKDDKGEDFVAEQFTDDYMVKVDAHSSSPIFAEDTKELAFALLKAKAITRERLLDLLPVPMRELLKKDLKEIIEPGEKEAAKMQMQMEMHKHPEGKKHLAAA
jgi:hypothetical protein